MRIRRIRTLVLLGFLASCEASSGWQTPSFPTTLEDVRSIRRATESGLGVTSSMRPDDTSGRPPGLMTPAQQRVALEARIDELEGLVSAQLQASGAGLPGTPTGAGSSGSSEEGAIAALDPAQAERLEALAQAVANVETRLNELPEGDPSEGLEQIESNLVDLSTQVTDLKLDTLRIDSNYAAKFTEVSQQVQTLSETSGEIAQPLTATARTNSSLIGKKPDVKLWGLLLGIPSLIALLGGWLFSRTGRSRSATVVEHIERRIDDVDERQARLEERQREALPLGKRGAYLAGAGAVGALRRSEDSVDREAADFFTNTETATKSLAQQEAEEFFSETAEAGAAEASPASADDETSFTLQPEPAPVERFERTREAFGVEPQAVPAPEDQWQGGGEDTLEARLARGIQERYFAESDGEASTNPTSGAIDWDQATREQAAERAEMNQLDEPIVKPSSSDGPADPPWAPLTAETERLESEESGWRDLAQRGADEAARYADGALDDEEQGSDDEPDLV